MMRPRRSGHLAQAGKLSIQRIGTMRSNPTGELK